MVSRLSEYNDYLQSMGGRLAHEIRTPIAVVRSSLDNLALQQLPGDAKIYMDRAREGLGRLSRIVASMTEATRLEHSLQQADLEPFDLADVVKGCVSGYRLAYRPCSFELTLPNDAVWIRGAPELIAQMLDKLAANAVDFASAGTAVAIGLEPSARGIVLYVDNEGPALPENMQRHLFDSMVSIRPAPSGGDPHLGIGLYIVRMIAEFHGGTAHAQNKPLFERLEALGIESGTSKAQLSRARAKLRDALREFAGEWIA